MIRLAFLFMLLIATASCSRESASTPAQLESDSTSAVKPHTFSSDDSFTPATIQLLDDVTSLPISGAEVSVLCLGGTRHQDSKTISNKNGLATVTYWDSDFVAVNIKKDGYVSASTFVQRSNPVYRLKLVP